MDALTVILFFYTSVICSFCNRGSKVKKGREEYESSSREVDQNSFTEPSISSNDSYTDRFNRGITEEQESYIREAIEDMEHSGNRGIYSFTDSSHSSTRASCKDSVYDQDDNDDHGHSSDDGHGHSSDQGSNWSGPSCSQGSYSGLASGGNSS